MNKTAQIVTWTLVVAALIAMSACSKGGETITGSNGTGLAPPAEPTVASGPLTGLGPLGLAGANFDDTTTQVLLNVNVSSNASTLRLGMTANTNGTSASTTATGQAFGAVAQSLVRGPATSVDTVANRIAVLSIALRVDQNTLLEGINSLTELAVGDEVEAFGLALAGNQGALATRLIVRRPAGVNVEVLGTIEELGISSLVVQGIPVNLANAQIGMTSANGVAFSATTPAALTQGMLIRVVGSYDTVSGVLSATTIVASLAPARPQGNLVFIEGFVRDLTAMTRFKLPDLEVDGASVPAALANVTIGTRVRVRGTMQSGFLKAEAIDIIQPTARTDLVVEGDVAAFASVASFQVRGELIDATQASFSGGSAANLANGKRVRVKGIAGPGRVIASEVVIVN
jgi:hypothetical protein